MSSLTLLVTQTLSLLTIVGGVFIVFFVVSWLIFSRSSFFSDINSFVNKYGLVIAFIVALIATSGSLFFSEAAGYEPCKLCWFQRIFMYPQVFILGTALWLKDRRVYRYVIPLASMGALIAIYHYYLQLGGSPLTPCSAVGYSVNCAKKFVLEFGYITIPVMAFTAFVLNIILMKVIRKSYHQ